MKNKKLVIAAAALVLVVALMAGIWFATRPETEAGSKGYAVTVVHKDGTVKEFSYRTDEEYLAGALLEEGLVSGEDGPYGLYVKTVDGETLDYDTHKKYWAFYENGTQAMTGVDKTDVVEGAVYAFRAE